MGAGVSGMFETCMVAILVAAMCALIREYGGLMHFLTGFTKSAERRVASLAWDSLSVPWILRLQIIR